MPFFSFTFFIFLFFMPEGRLAKVKNPGRVMNDEMGGKEKYEHFFFFLRVGCLFVFL